MKFLVTLKRKQTINEAQNARKIRIEVQARNEDSAKTEALQRDGNRRYFTVESVRRA